jgi:hypothetical protein
MTKNVCAAATSGRHGWSHPCAAHAVSHRIGPDHERTGGLSAALPILIQFPFCNILQYPVTLLF